MPTEAKAFGLKQSKLAPWLSAETWGTAVTVDLVSLYGVQFEMVSGRLEGDDMRGALVAKLVGGTARLRFALSKLSVFATLTGLSVANSTPDNESIVFSAANMPYFGITGRVDHDTGAGAYELFIPKCKIMGNIPFEMQFGQFVTPEIQCEFIYDSATYGFGKLISRATAGAVAVPAS